MSWHLHWDSSFDLSRGGTELSFRTHSDMSQLLVETEPIRLVSRIIEKIATAYISTRYHIIGTRGFGKSTLLNYITFCLFSNLDSQRVLPVYGSLLGTASNEKELEFIFFRSLLESLFNVPSDMQRFPSKEKFTEAQKQLTDAKEEYKMELKKLGQVSPEYIYAAFENQMEHLAKTFDKIAFLIDGLDKQETDVVVKFLRNTQERMNTLVSKYNCVFFDAADPSWRETLETKEFSGVRGVPINLHVWTADEVEALVRKRLETIGIYQLPFERKALEILVEDFQGNPREILQYATTLLHFAAKEHIATIGPGLARKIVWSNGSKEKFFNQITSDSDVRYAFEKLKTIYTDRQMINILVATYNQRGQRLFKNLNYEGRSSIGITLTDDSFQKSLSILLTKGCLKTSKMPNCLELEEDMKKFFDFVTKLGESLVALPVVLSELEFKVESVAPLPKEEIIIKEEIQKVFEQHPKEWLDYRLCKELLLENPRTKKKLEEHYKEESDKKITSTIPLIVHSLVEDGKLMQDSEKSRFRWRPSSIDFETADLFRSMIILDTIDSAEQTLEDGNMEELAKLCDKLFWESFLEINAIFGGRVSSTDTHKVVAFLEHLGMNVTKPIPLDMFLASLRETTPESDEAKVWLQTAILYAKRTFAELQRLHSYEPKNQEIISKLMKCKTGVLKREEREYFRAVLLPVLITDYGRLVECMTEIKLRKGTLTKVPPELTALVNKQILPAELYECPACKKLTIVSAKEISAIHCPEDKVPLTRIKPCYVLSTEAYEAWNVWMEEYAEAMLSQLPCKYVETGVALKPIEAAAISSPEEVDLAVVFNGKSIAIECMENVVIAPERDDVANVIHKIESLGLFDSIILIYRYTNNPQGFNATVKKHEKFLFTTLVEGPRGFKTRLHQILKSIESASKT